LQDAGSSSAGFDEELSFFQSSNGKPGLPAKKARQKKIRRVGKSTARGKASGFLQQPSGKWEENKEVLCPKPAGGRLFSQ
jgi:hypothetical protein